MTKVEIIEGLSGAAQAFNALEVDFQSDTIMTVKTVQGNPYTFVVNDENDMFLTVYDTDLPSGHVTRITFGPSEIWDTVKQNLEINFDIDAETIEERIPRNAVNLDVVTLEFYDDEDSNGEQFADGELNMIRMVADAVMDTLCDLE